MNSIKCMEKTSILYILPKFNYFSAGWRGRVTHALGVANGCRSNGCEVTVIAGNGYHEFQNVFKTEVKLIGVNPPKFKWNSSISLLKSIGKCLEKIKNQPSRIIIRYAVSNVLLNLRLPRKINHNYVKIIEINSLAFHQLHTLPMVLRKAIIKFEIQLIKGYDLIYTVSDNIRNDLLLYGCKNAITVVPNGTTLTIENTEKQSDIADRLVYFGKFQTYYDFEYLIDTFENIHERYGNLELHLWGSGIQQKSVEKSLEGIHNVYFHGQYNRDELVHAINPNHDILVLPLKPKGMSEIGSPTKLFEFLSTGSPVIAADVGQIGQIIVDQQNGLLYNPTEKYSLQNKISYLLENREERIALGNNAYEDVRTKYTWEVRMKSLLESINQVRT